MTSEPSIPNCPQCGAAIPADAPQGLCPRCVLLGAATVTDAGRPVPRSEPPSPDALRAAFPHLEIVGLIGRGGMGYVYKARQAKLDRTVALKLLPVELGADPHFAERFHREARALARLNHPGIVAVYDFGVSAGFCYLLMEFVDGVNLRQAMQAGRFTQHEALALVPKICEAIQFAHEQGVLHRDIKPENILLDTQGRVKIADFGIAKLVGEDAPDLTLTLSGARLGTPSYMAPEQIEQPSAVDHRADIYSLGVVFYELLTGELPLGRFAPPSAKATLDARVDDIVMRALAKERELRQQSAGEVKTQVETVAASPRPSAESSSVAPAAPANGRLRPAEGEYRSPMTFWGWPLLHVAFGRDPATGKMRTARGVFAIGNHAVGGLAIGGTACGVIAFGGLAVGGIALGGLGLGLFAFGGIALGLFSIGGISLGLLLALGGGALGYQAGGGLAIGRIAAGGLAIGHHVWDGRVQDEGAHWLIDLVRSGGLQAILLIFGGLASVVPAVAMAWAARLVRQGAEPAPPDESPTPPSPPVPPSGAVRGWLGRWLLVIAGVIGALLVFVAGQTVHDLGMGRSRIQPVELVAFLVVTGAALLCWRLGRRLHCHSVPAVPVESLLARPFLLAGVAPAWKPWLLLGLGLSGALLCFQAVVLLLPMVGALAGVVRSGPLPFMLMVLAGSALIAGAWHGSLRRRELLGSLSLHVPETGPVLDRWLSRAVVLLLAGLGGGMLIGLGSLFIVVAGQLNGNPGSNGLLLAAVIVIIGLAASWQRRAASPPAPTPAPAWMRRAAWWFLAAGFVALLPTLMHWNSSTSVWHRASLLVFTGLALLSAHPGLRRLALVVNWFGLFSGLGGSLALLWLGSRHELPQGISIGVPGMTTRPGIALLVGLLETGVFAAGLLALHRVDARAAFGTAASTGWRRWLGRAGVAAFFVVVMGFQLFFAKQAARPAGPQSEAVARLMETPAGGDRAWLQVNSPAQTRVQFTVNCWSNGVPRQLSEGAWSPGELLFATNVPFQQFITRAVRPGGDGQTWDVSDYEPDGLTGEQWTDSGIPLTVPLRAAAHPGTAVQLNPGDRLRRWLFLPEVEAQQVASGGTGSANPTWGISLDLELTSDQPPTAAPEAEAVVPKSPTVARFQLLLPRNQRGRLTIVRWHDGQPIEALASFSLPHFITGAEGTRVALRWELHPLPPIEGESAASASRIKLTGPFAEGPDGYEVTGVRHTWTSNGPELIDLQPVASRADIEGAQAARRWLFWSAQDAAEYARTGQLPERIQSGFSAEYEPQAAPAGADAQAAIELSVLLREKAAGLRRRFEAGAATALEVAAAERDHLVAFALARGDYLNAAQAYRTYAQLVLEDGRKRFEAGKLTSLELRGMEATNQMAELQLAERRQAITNRNQWPVVQIASLRLELAKRALEELKRRVEVGAVAATGPELSVAVQDVEAAETALKQVRIAASKAQLAELEKQYSDTNALHRAGKVRSTEFELTKLRFQRAQKEHQALVRQLDDSPAGLEWRKAWDRFQLVDEQAKAGRTSPLQWAFANMELDVAEARHGNDPLKEAYAVESYRREVLRVYREELGKGQRGRAEVDSAESMLKDAEIARQTIEQSRKLATPSP